jgi:predicted  nucleic acid-binding Zn-ribbon protein
LWLSDIFGAQMNSNSQNKKGSIRAIREEYLLFLQDEVETLKDRNNWLEDELEEANDVIYRLEHGLPVSFSEEIE